MSLLDNRFRPRALFSFKDHSGPEGAPEGHLAEKDGGYLSRFSADDPCLIITAIAGSGIAHPSPWQGVA